MKICATVFELQEGARLYATNRRFAQGPLAPETCYSCLLKRMLWPILSAPWQHPCEHSSTLVLEAQLDHLGATLTQLCCLHLMEVGAIIHGPETRATTKQASCRCCNWLARRATDEKVVIRSHLKRAMLGREVHKIPLDRCMPLSCRYADPSF